MVLIGLALSSPAMQAVGFVLMFVPLQLFSADIIRLILKNDELRTSNKLALIGLAMLPGVIAAILQFGFAATRFS